MNPAVQAILTRLSRIFPVLLCIGVIGAHLVMIDLKGISTDEGIRLGIINGGRSFVTPAPLPLPGYDEVLATLRPYAYQPAYYLLQNTLMRLTGRQDLLLFRLVNVFFLGVCLLGLLVLSRTWTPASRVFLVGLFAGNAYLIMHVLQIREYIAAVAFYIWSTWLVLRLDHRHLAREWTDIGWFLLYGLLLTFGFYLQTWTVFPAVAQGLFLVLRCRPQLVRFLAHLGLSYILVVTLTWFYLQANTQKINVGLWSSGQFNLFDQLLHGLQLVLSGHLANEHRFAGLLTCCWLALLLAGSWLFWRHRRQLPPGFVTETWRQSQLMLASISVPLAFQIAYYYKVEPLSVWPRYFIVHYFFACWLLALAFRTLLVARLLPNVRRPTVVATSGIGLLLAISAAYQVQSYCRDPYFDTGLTEASNWRTNARALRTHLRPNDVVFAHDFVARSTLTATLPLPSPVLLLPELEQVGLNGAPRLVYLESSWVKAQRPELQQRMAARGYPHMEILPVLANNGTEPVRDWCILAFSPR